MSHAVNVVFDGPPSPESGRFVEVELDSGCSVGIGEWKRREDGLWSLRITAEEIIETVTKGANPHNEAQDPRSRK